MKKDVKKIIFYSFALLALAASSPSIMSHFSKTNAFLKIKNTLDNHCLIKNSRKSSCYIHQDRLDKVIKKGLPAWAKTQIAEDLSHYPSFTKTDLDREEKALKAYRFTLKEGKLTTNRVETRDQGREVIKDVLNYLSENGYIQNTDFLISTDDYHRPLEPFKVPLFVFAKNLADSLEKDGVLVPDWMNLSESAQLERDIKEGIRQFPWAQKKSQFFWRGAASTPRRDALIGWSLENPHRIDAQLTSDKILFVEPAEHLRYKYLISMDGVRCSWTRLVWGLSSNSLVFKDQSSQAQWFYKGIKPDVHYKPFHNKTSLLEGFVWAENNPMEAQSIIHNASSFARDNLSLEDMYHYFIVLIEEYNKLLKN